MRVIYCCYGFSLFNRVIQCVLCNNAIFTISIFISHRSVIWNIHIDHVLSFFRNKCHGRLCNPLLNTFRDKIFILEPVYDGLLDDNSSLSETSTLNDFQARLLSLFSLNLKMNVITTDQHIHYFVLMEVLIFVVIFLRIHIRGITVK